MTVSQLGAAVNATTKEGFIRWLCDWPRVARFTSDQFEHAALTAFGIYYIHDIEAHRLTDAAEYLEGLTLSELYALAVRLVEANATTQSAVRYFIDQQL